MSFAYPWLLPALLALPVLWWLLRVTPPAPRRQAFPAVALLAGLSADQTSAARTPWWLLLLRLVAAALTIIALAGPVRHPATAAGPAGPVVVVIDNGWAAAADWAERLRAASRALTDQADNSSQTRLLATTTDADGVLPAAGPPMSKTDLLAAIAALRPMPWPVDRITAARMLASLPAQTRIIYVADGIATAGDAAFAAALGRFQVTELRGTPTGAVLRPPEAAAAQFGLRVEALPGTARSGLVKAFGRDGTVLGETELVFGPGGTATGTLVLPPDLRNRASVLRLGEQASAASMVLLDAQSRRHPVGLLEAAGAQDQPLTGALYYVRAALGGNADVSSGPLDTLLHRPLAVIVAADQTLPDQDRRQALLRWVKAGGMLIRFAGPALAATTAPDPLLPVALLAGDRALGGAMSWSRPAALAAFAAGSPFAGLAIPSEVRVWRQVLTQPGRQPDTAAAEVWATLADGTPLVTQAALGAGKLVLFHVTANAEWSSLPLSGLFVDMLHRLVDLSAGIRAGAGDAPLAPRRILDGFGQAGDPGGAARSIAARDIAAMPASPAHPPGLYGPPDAARALNLSATLPRPETEPPIPRAIEHGFDGAGLIRPWGPSLLAAALVLLILDLLAGLRLRGLLGAAAAGLLLASTPGQAAPPAMPSLATHLAYVVTGDSRADGISSEGLQGLSDFVNQRTAAVLAAPVGVDPAHDDLSFYPLIYWPILSDTPDPDGTAIARIDDYMENGGIVVFDTRDAGAPDEGADAALRRIGSALAIPPLIRLTSAHVLSHSFYLLRDWPGRFANAPVWIDRRQDPSNDSVSPVIIGGNDWAAAWATDSSGTNPYDVSGGEEQRLLAYRFGVNLVMYALTGNYKADQVHVPELFRRMGQPAPIDNGAQSLTP